MILQVGARVFAVTSMAHASEVYGTYRDQTGLGGSEFPDGELFDGAGTLIARVSYNARVWPPEPWRPDLEPLFSPTSPAT